MGGFALITGASSGIGEEFAYQLAARGYNLILVARRESLLNAIAHEIREKNSVEVVVISSDLSIPQGIEDVISSIQDFSPISYLVNNAGFANVGDIDEVDWIKHHSMINVHVLASTRLIHDLTIIYFL